MYTMIRRTSFIWRLSQYIAKSTGGRHRGHRAAAAAVAAAAAAVTHLRCSGVGGRAGPTPTQKFDQKGALRALAPMFALRCELRKMRRASSLHVPLVWDGRGVCRRLRPRRVRVGRSGVCGGVGGVCRENECIDLFLLELCCRRRIPCGVQPGRAEDAAA